MAEYRDLIGVVLGLLIPLVVAALIGTQLIRRGLRRRVGTARHCARCNYELTGIDSARCPECGAELMGANVAVGERRRSAWRVAAGMLIIVIVVGYVGWSARRIDWYSYRPSSWLADDLASTNAARVGRAWSILKDRRAAAVLPENAERKVVRAILDEHRNGMPGRLSGEMYAFFSEMYRAGRLTEAEQQEFFSNVMKTKLVVRPVVVAGGDLPFRVSGCRRMMPDADWWIRQSFEGGTSSWMSGGAPFGTPTARSGVLRGLVGRAIGKQRIEVVQRVDFFRGKRGNDKESRMIRSVETRHPVEVTVVEEGSSAFFRVIDDPAMADPIRQSITLSAIELKDGYVSGTISVRRAPTNLAFDVLVNDGRLEKDVASVEVAKGDGSSLTFGPFPFKTDAEAVDLVLRANPALGGATIDLFEAWKGEIVFEDQALNRPTSRVGAK